MIMRPIKLKKSPSMLRRVLSRFALRDEVDIVGSRDTPDAREGNNEHDHDDDGSDSRASEVSIDSCLSSQSSSSFSLLSTRDSTSSSPSQSWFAVTQQSSHHPSLSSSSSPAAGDGSEPSSGQKGLLVNQGEAQAHPGSSTNNLIAAVGRPSCIPLHPPHSLTSALKTLRGQSHATTDAICITPPAILEMVNAKKLSGVVGDPRNISSIHGCDLMYSGKMGSIISLFFPF